MTGSILISCSVPKSGVGNSRGSFIMRVSSGEAAKKGAIPELIREVGSITP